MQPIAPTLHKPAFAVPYVIRSAKIVSNMKITLNLLGAILVVFGCIWFLQGINILPGSFMSGQIQWALYGAIAVVVGIGLLIWAKRRRS